MYIVFKIHFDSVDKNFNFVITIIKNQNLQ